MRCVAHGCNNAVVKAVRSQSMYFSVQLPKIDTEMEETDIGEYIELEEDFPPDEDAFPYTSLESFVNDLKNIAVEFRHNATRTHRLRISFDNLQSKFEQASQKNFRLFSLYCPTRWSSLYGMLDPFISNKDVLNSQESVISALTHDSSTIKQREKAANIARFFQEQDTFAIISALHFVLGQVKFTIEELSSNSVDTLCGSMWTMLSLIYFLNNAKNLFQKIEYNSTYQLEEREIAVAVMSCADISSAIATELIRQWSHVIDITKELDMLYNMMLDEETEISDKSNRFKSIVESMEPEKLTIMSATFLSPHLSDFPFIVDLIDQENSEQILPFCTQLFGSVDNVKTLLSRKIFDNFLSYLVEYQIELYFLRKNKLLTMKIPQPVDGTKYIDTIAENESCKMHKEEEANKEESTGKRKNGTQEIHPEQKRIKINLPKKRRILALQSTTTDTSVSNEGHSLNTMQLNFMADLKRDLSVYKSGFLECDIEKSNKSVSLWWKEVGRERFPTLAQAARIIFSPSPSSTSIERFFSHTRRVKTELRHSLTDENFEISSLYGIYMQDNSKADEFSRKRCNI